MADFAVRLDRKGRRWLFHVYMEPTDGAYFNFPTLIGSASEGPLLGKDPSMSDQTAPKNDESTEQEQPQQEAPQQEVNVNVEQPDATNQPAGGDGESTNQED